MKQLRDPFNPTTGAFAVNIRNITGDNTELRESMKTFGWVKEFPALLDERDYVLVGNRRMAIAKELGIAPITKTLQFGEGDAADAERLKLAIASNIGGKPLTRADRKRLAHYLYEREWTMARIGEALNVSLNTVHHDLDGFSTVEKPSRSKGGRPKGSSKAAKSERKLGVESCAPEEQIKRQAAASLVLDKGYGLEEAGAELDIGSRDPIRLAVAYEQGRRAAQAEPEIEQAALSLTAQQKLDAAIRQHKRKLDIEFEQRVQDEYRKRMNDVLPEFKEQQEHYERVIKNRKGILSRADFKKILSRLHPDNVQGGESKRRNEEAFHIFKRLELQLLDEKAAPTPVIDMPANYQEWAARRKSTAAARSKTKTGVATR
jgi:hypothetical protein